MDSEYLREVLQYRPQHFRWAGCDTFTVTNRDGKRQVVVIETNSCPSGQKSMPLVNDTNEMGGYRTLLESTFRELLETAPEDGILAVVYDKNFMEASGYASTLAELTGEKVRLLSPCHSCRNLSCVSHSSLLVITVQPDA